MSDRTSPPVIPSSALPLRRSRLPSRWRLPILLGLNLGLSAVLLPFANDLLGHELGSISRRASEGDDLITPASRLVYKILILWLGWRLNYDFIDISMLTTITEVPYAYLIATYYGISFTTVAVHVANEVLAIAIPTYLLRPRSAVNNTKAPLPNRYLLDSFQVHCANVLLAVCVYVVVLFAALKTSQLSVFLLTHFDLVTLEVAHAETAVPLIIKLLVAGFATKSFLLNPSLGAASAAGSLTPVEVFEPATATLPQTFKQNFFFFSRRTRTLIQQTTILSVFLLANTVRRCLSLSNSDPNFGTRFVGAVGYAAPWILANVICAGWWTWIGDAEA